MFIRRGGKVILKDGILRMDGLNGGYNSGRVSWHIDYHDLVDWSHHARL